MNWDAVGAIAELVGAVGVIASLAYLALQIRQNTQHIDFNTRAIRSSTFQNFSDTFGGFEDLLLENEDLGRVWIAGISGELEAHDGERIQFNNLAHKFFRMYEVLFLQYQSGLVETSLFESAHRFPDQLLMRRGLRSYWANNRRRYSDEFVGYIERRLEELPTLPGRAPEGSSHERLPRHPDGLTET